MSKTTIVILVIGLVLVGGITALVIMFQPDHDWRKRYLINGDEPFDLSFTKQLLEESSELTILKDSLVLPEDGTGSLIWMRRSIDLSERDSAAMFQFIEGGGHVFMAANDFPTKVVKMLDSNMDSLYNSYDGTYNTYYSSLDVRPYYNEKACFYISDQAGEACIRGVVSGKFRDTEWNYFDLDDFQSDYDWSTPLWLETDSRDQPIVLDFEIGEGVLSLCSSPILFTNYYLADSAIFEMNSSLLATLSRENMHLSTVPDPSPIPRSRDANVSESPLSFVLKEKSLKAAWFVLVGTVLLFLIFGSRRKQGIIGYWKPKQNATLVYADQIATLYRQGENLGEMGQSELKWFLYRLKERYGLVIKPEDISRNASIDMISEASGAPRGDVAVLTDKLDKARNYVHSLDELRHLSSTTNTFYKSYI